MAFSPPEYCRLFAQKKAYQGGSRVPQEPPPPAMPLERVRVLKEIFLVVDKTAYFHYF